MEDFASRYNYLYEFLHAHELRKQDTPFYALIMAAMWGADTDNCEKLKAAFPNVWRELQELYDTGIPVGIQKNFTISIGK